MGVEIIGRDEAHDRGMTDSEMQRLCRSGAWIRVQPGIYVVSSDLVGLDPCDRHRAFASAVLRGSSPDAVLSHQSAAAVHGIDMWDTSLRCVHLTRHRRSGGRIAGNRHVHSGSLDRDDVVVVDGLRVTSIARTVVDLARTLPFEQALVAGDHALHATSLRTADLDPVLERVRTHPGYRQARRALDAFDGRSESVGESRSRVLFVREQLPIPIPQVKLYAPNGSRVARVDFLFEDLGVAAEFDGRVKYGRLVPEGQTAADVLWSEKQREDAIRGLGWQMVRWTWDELERPNIIARRLYDAVDRAKLSARPQGSVVHTVRP